MATPRYYHVSPPTQQEQSVAIAAAIDAMIGDISTELGAKATLRFQTKTVVLSRHLNS
ncbi:hypothetical protein [Rhizobium mesoamericanum]|uniref:Uncharacterized protein n=1 Tax=Rhizobium mesoamericanum STM3625 TaxID=1211777 RepID=K0PVE6_9HYPH|nr:hypothetical protein [Rhizobium mesoamericanum]CCM75485.1 hypothetical protein BN77_2640 [Rhizobium mesoamericanum STM3625]